MKSRKTLGKTIKNLGDMKVSLHREYLKLITAHQVLVEDAGLLQSYEVFLKVLNGRVRRELAWAQFQRGEPIALPEIENVGGPIQDISNDPEPLLPDAADDESWFEETREL